MSTLRYRACAYKNGKPWKFIIVYASCKDEAYNVAWNEFQKMGIYPEKLDIDFSAF